MLFQVLEFGMTEVSLLVFFLLSVKIYVCAVCAFLKHLLAQQCSFIVLICIANADLAVQASLYCFTVKYAAEAAGTVCL